ncbi:SH3 domain-containing protein [Novosphingopyxis sp.]|uniref:SH3 domain-containing protein n=1 Tax=Novosphingopyxis sp. TaxID=2709690 RepID=UPI003B59BB7F
MQFRPILFAITLVAALVAFAVPVAAQSDPELPYWASIDVDEARMRAGPSTEFPIKWIYRRKYLPVKVIDRMDGWRKVEDPAGDQGWMHSRLLSGDRTAIVTGDIRAMRGEPSPNAHVAWRAEPGVVGRISDCDKGWCLFDVAGQRGWIQADGIWGEEELPRAERK